MKKQRQFYTTTSNTFDASAIAINNELNDVARMCKIGHSLAKILNEQFNGCVKSFRRWCKGNLDKDEKSIFRYITLAQNEEMLKRRGIIRLSEAYELLGIDGNVVDFAGLEV